MSDIFYILSCLLQSEPICADWENLHQKTVAVITIQNAWRTFTLRKYFLVKRYATIKIQSHWRAWCMRMNFLKMVKSATKIQACTRCMLFVQAFNRYKLAATIIQKFVRGHLARNSLLGTSFLIAFVIRDHAFLKTFYVHLLFSSNSFCAESVIAFWC